MFRSPSTRRELLHSWAAVALAGMLSPRSRNSDQSALERRQPTELNLSCSCLAFTDLKWEESLEEIKSLGFRFAELAMSEGLGHVSPSALGDPEVHAKKIIASCSRIAVEPIAIEANFVLGAPNQFPGITTPDAAARKTILAQFERVVACARVAEIPLVIVQAGRLVDSVSVDTCFKNACDVLLQMHALVARRGLMLAIKNQTGSIAQEPDDCQKILERVPGLRIDYDMGYVVANQQSIEQTEPIMKHIAHVAIRNAVPGDYGVSLRDGELSYSVHPFLSALRRERVNAYLSVQSGQVSRQANIAGIKSILEQEGIP